MFASTVANVSNLCRTAPRGEWQPQLGGRKDAIGWATNRPLCRLLPIGKHRRLPGRRHTSGCELHGFTHKGTSMRFPKRLGAFQRMRKHDPGNFWLRSHMHALWPKAPGLQATSPHSRTLRVESGRGRLDL